MPAHPAAHEIPGLYERHAAHWDALRAGGRLEQHWLARFAALLPAGGRVLDMGCGGGDPIATTLTQIGFVVTGVDVSPAMVAMFRRRLAGAACHAADMRNLDLGETFSGLVAWDSFFHLSADDQRGMFPIFRKHAAPNAALMFTSGPEEGVAIGDMKGEPLYHASLSPQEYRALLIAQCFEVVAYVPEDPTCGRHTIWLARLR